MTTNRSAGGWIVLMLCLCLVFGLAQTSAWAAGGAPRQAFRLGASIAEFGMMESDYAHGPTRDDTIFGLGGGFTPGLTFGYLFRGYHEVGANIVLSYRKTEQGAVSTDTVLRGVSYYNFNIPTGAPILPFVGPRLGYMSDVNHTKESSGHSSNQNGIIYGLEGGVKLFFSPIGSIDIKFVFDRSNINNDEKVSGKKTSNDYTGQELGVVLGLSLWL